MRSRFNLAFSTALICALQAALSFAAESSYAETRKPAAREIAAIRDCATRNKDNLNEGERLCLFNLVADPCINKPSGDANQPTEADCYHVEDSIWDGLLNENYKGLLDTLDDGQTAKAHAMQRAWMAYRDTTCRFLTTRSRVRWRPRCTPPALRASPRAGRCCSNSLLDCKPRSRWNQGRRGAFAEVDLGAFPEGG